MEKKWIIYKIICFFEFALSLMIFLYFFRNWIESFSINENIFSKINDFDFIFFAAFGLFTIFHSFCLHLILKKYPNNEIGKSYENVFFVFFMLSLILFLGMLLVFVGGIYELLNGFDNSKNNTRPILIFIACTFHILGHFYCLKKSFELKAVITKNFKEKQQTVINNIGAN